MRLRKSIMTASETVDTYELYCKAKQFKNELEKIQLTQFHQNSLEYVNKLLECFNNGLDRQLVVDIYNLKANRREDIYTKEVLKRFVYRMIQDISDFPSDGLQTTIRPDKYNLYWRIKNYKIRIENNNTNTIFNINCLDILDELLDVFTDCSISMEELRQDIKKLYSNNIPITDQEDDIVFTLQLFWVQIQDHFFLMTSLTRRKRLSKCNISNSH